MSDSFFLPCPFCGKAPKAKFPDEDGGCTLRHPIGGCEFLSGQIWLFATPEEAAKAWNYRAASEWMADEYLLEDGRIVAVVFGETKYVKESER